MGRGRFSVLSTIVAIAIGTFGADASALSFGRLNIQSAFGEPLRAEIEVTEVTAAEASGLKVFIASPSTFSTAGVPYNAALNDIRVNIQRRTDGHYVIRLSSDRVLTEPSIDLLIEANWGQGQSQRRVVRDYTMQLASPASNQAAAPLPAPAVPPQISAPFVETPSPAPTREPETPRANANANASLSASAREQQVIVQTGDTASGIAITRKPSNASLDQMLMALLGANPRAFVSGNVNRLRAGAVLDMPAASEVESISATEARRAIIAQNQDFIEYRRRLAKNAANTQVADAKPQTTDKAPPPSVKEPSAADAPADRLKISQGSAPAGRPSDEQVALAAETKARQDREQELSRNLQELNQLKAAASGTTAPTTTTSPTPTTNPAPASDPSSSGSTAAPKSPAAATSSAPRAPTPLPEKQGFFAALMEKPLMAAVTALIVLLLGFLLYRIFGRKRQDPDSIASANAFIDDHQIPTDPLAGDGEPMESEHHSDFVAPSPPAPPAPSPAPPAQTSTDNADPVAEAEVYLAFGRDFQAEGILREALRTNPKPSVYLKLLEIYAKRPDPRAYEALAVEVRQLTGGHGTEWDRVVEVGKTLDAGNPLYA
jgi:pilus assembly protein FimV